MSGRVPLTLFTNVGSIIPHASWTDPLNPSDPWNGYPYQWRVTLTVQAQSHGDPTTPRPFAYNALDVSVGNWLVFGTASLTVEIISIISQTDFSVTAIVEDVGLYNIINDASQAGQGIGPPSPPGQFDCLIAGLNPSGQLVFSSIPDYSVPINLLNDISNRFQFRNFVQDYIPATQPGHTFSIGDVIYIDDSGDYQKSSATITDSLNSIGTVTSVNLPSVGDFTYRPLGRYVTNLPSLPGDIGRVLYVSATTPGGLTTVPPSPYAIPVYIKISQTSAILTAGSGGGGGSAGNLTILGNSISATNPNGNINLVPNGSGTVTMPRVAVGNIVINGTNIGATNANVTVVTDLDLSGNRIINVLNPQQDQDVATKSYVDAVASGLHTKDAVYVATTADLNATFTPLVGFGSLTGNIYERLEIDGEEPAVDARVLVKNQDDPLENGLYRVVQIGSPSEAWVLTRTDDFDGQGAQGEVQTGDFVFVEVGHTNGSTGWVMTTPNPITVNSSPIYWTQFSAAGVIQAGFGLSKTGTVLSVNVAAIINTNTGLNAAPGPTGNDIIVISLAENTPLEFAAGYLRVNGNIAGSGLSYDLSVGNLSVNNNQPSIVGLGNVTSGTWSANVISTSYGGTGRSTIGTASQVLVVNDDGNGLEYQFRSKLTESDLPPIYPTPADGDRWYNTDTGILFTRITDSNGGHWIEL